MNHYNTLFIRLEGPMQSWGIRARWDRPRETMPEPTKSGVVGLIAGVLGLKRDEDEQIQSLSKKMRFGVRVDGEGELMRDLQTVTGDLPNAKGDMLSTTIVKECHYLADASFLVALQSPDEELITRVADALQNPHWPPYLGRRSCPPSAPLFVDLGHYDSLKEALCSQPLPEHILAEYKRKDRQSDEIAVRISVECQPNEGNARPDNIESLKLRRYRPRYAHDDMLRFSISPGDPCINEEE